MPKIDQILYTSSILRAHQWNSFEPAAAGLISANGLAARGPRVLSLRSICRHEHAAGDKPTSLRSAPACTVDTEGNAQRPVLVARANVLRAYLKRLHPKP